MPGLTLKTTHTHHENFPKRNEFFREKRMVSAGFSTARDLAKAPDPENVAKTMFHLPTTKAFGDAIVKIASGEYQPVAKTKELIADVRKGIKKTLGETRGIGVDLVRTAVGEKALWDTGGRILEDTKNLTVGTIKAGIRTAAIAAATPFAAGRLVLALTAGIGSRLILTAQEGLQIGAGAPSRPIKPVENRLTSAVEKTADIPDNIIRTTFGKARNVFNKLAGEAGGANPLPAAA